MKELLDLAIFGSFIWFAIFASILTILLFLAEHEKNGFIATLAVLVFLGINYFWGNIDVVYTFTLRNVLVYLFIGFIYSLLRAYLAGRNKTLEERERYLNSELKGNVFRWWFLSPISLVYWIASDLVGEVYDFVYDKLKIFYSSIFNLSKLK